MAKEAKWKLQNINKESDKIKANIRKTKDQIDLLEKKIQFSKWNI